MGMIAKKEFYILGVVLIVVVAFAVGLPLMLTGQTVTIGEHPESEAADAVTCEVGGVKYPVILTPSGEVGENISIRMMFNQGKLATLGLYYAAEYDSDETALSAYNASQAEMNTRVVQAGIKNGVLDVKFSRSGRAIWMNLYIKGSEIDEKTAPFLMLSDVPESKSEYVREYESLGMKCE